MANFQWIRNRDAAFYYVPDLSHNDAGIRWGGRTAIGLYQSWTF
jgi:hypothetical protein